MEIIKCPQCQRQLHVPEHYVGQKVQCPECRHTFLAATTAVSAQPQSQAGPVPPPTSVEPRRRDYDEDDVDVRVPRRRRYEDDADDDDHDEFDPMHRRVGRGYMAPHRGGVILAFGLISLTACALFGPIAWVLGNQDLAEMRAGRMDPSGEGLTRAGQICGIVGTIFLALSALWFFFVLGVGIR